MRKKSLLIMLVLLLFLFTAISGCSSNKSHSSNNSSSGSNQEQQNIISNEKKIFSIGETFALNGGTFRVDNVEMLDKIKNKFSGGYYHPNNEKFLVVYYTFKGNGSAGAFNPDSIKIRVNGKLFDPVNNVDIATDYAHQKKITPLSFALWSKTTPKKFLDVYDIPATDKLSICWLGNRNGKLVEIAEVAVANLEKTEEKVGYKYATAKEWMQIAVEEARKWHSNIRIYMINGSNVSVAESVDFSEGNDKAERLRIAPTDGKALYWEYYFISPTDKNYLYIVEVSDGKVVKSKKSEIAAMFISPEEALLPSQVKVDSNEAANIAIDFLNSKNTFNKKDGLLIKYSFSYPLQFRESNGTLIPVWMVKITTFSKQYLEVDINANNKKILKKAIMNE